MRPYRDYGGFLGLCAMITIENISKSFGSQVLFKDAGFRLNSRERVGVVGRNGHGKTTLFKMITGEDRPDSGKIIIPGNYRMGYVRQHISFTENTVLKEGMLGLTEAEKDHHWKVEKVLAGLGFSKDDMQKNPFEFSGGYQVRLNLAKVLVSEPDLLLLDEPTNYLDITSIRWIERFLCAWPRELMLITHDRGFMDKVITHTLAIHRMKFRKIEGDTGKLYAQIARDEEVYERTRKNDEKRQKEIEQFITRFRAKARLANLVQSRIKTLEKMEKKEKLESVKNLDFSFRSKPLKGKSLAAVSGLVFSYDGKKPVINGLDFNVKPGDRICIIGKNGKGKTTLIKLLAGVLKPRKGKILYNPNVVKGFYEQTNIKTLVDTRTVLDEILYSADIDLQAARNICGAMMFEGDAALKKIGVLSGGEKSRVMLGKILATPVNLLLLDEPTNHLDMESCDALLAALDAFEGAVIMVTHNEMFLHALARRLIVFKDGGVFMFEGGYGRFLEKEGWGDDELSGKSLKEKKQEPDSKISKKELRKLRSEIIAEKSKVLKPLKNEIQSLEDEIDSLEKEMDRLNLAIQEASQNGDGMKIAGLGKSIHECQQKIDARFDRLEILTETFEEKRAMFETRLATSEESSGFYFDRV